MTRRILQNGTDAHHARVGRARPVIGRSSPIARHPLASFFVLAYAIAWAPLPLGTFAAFGPLAAALQPRTSRWAPRGPR
jgi:hypothetical protein